MDQPADPALDSAIRARLLEAREALSVHWPGQERVFLKGERIHTENAHKWTLEGFDALLREAGCTRTQAWTDARLRFALWLAA